jgi:hypothetical protein
MTPSEWPQEWNDADEGCNFVYLVIVFDLHVGFEYQSRC